jgi:hypothetical protein
MRICLRRREFILGVGSAAVGPIVARALYRRNKSVGGWLGRAADGKGGYTFIEIPGEPDDVESANGSTVLRV